MAAKTGGNGCPGLSALSEICQQRGNLEKCQLLVVCSNIKEQVISFSSDDMFSSIAILHMMYTFVIRVPNKAWLAVLTK